MRLGILSSALLLTALLGGGAAAERFRVHKTLEDQLRTLDPESRIYRVQSFAPLRPAWKKELREGMFFRIAQRGVQGDRMYFANLIHRQSPMLPFIHLPDSTPSGQLLAVWIQKHPQTPPTFLNFARLQTDRFPTILRSLQDLSVPFTKLNSLRD